MSQVEELMRQLQAKQAEQKQCSERAAAVEQSIAAIHARFAKGQKRWQTKSDTLRSAQDVHAQSCASIPDSP